MVWLTFSWRVALRRDLVWSQGLNASLMPEASQVYSTTEHTLFDPELGSQWVRIDRTINVLSYDILRRMINSEHFSVFHRKRLDKPYFKIL